MCRRDAFWIGCDRGGAPILLLLRAFEIGFPDPAHVRLVQSGAWDKTPPRGALAVGRIDAVDQELEFERPLAGIAQRERRGKGEIGAGRVAADREPRRVDAEPSPFARRQSNHREEFLVRDREFDLGRQLVIDRQCGDAALPYEIAQEMVPAWDVALHKAAAMRVDEEWRTLNAVRQIEPA